MFLVKVAQDIQKEQEHLLKYNCSTEYIIVFTHFASIDHFIVVQVRGLLRSEVIAYDLFSSAQCQNDPQASYFEYVISEKTVISLIVCAL